MRRGRVRVPRRGRLPVSSVARVRAPSRARARRFATRRESVAPPRRRNRAAGAPAHLPGRSRADRERLRSEPIPESRGADCDATGEDVAGAACRGRPSAGTARATALETGRACARGATVRSIDEVASRRSGPVTRRSSSTRPAGRDGGGSDAGDGLRSEAPDRTVRGQAAAARDCRRGRLGGGHGRRRAGAADQVPQERQRPEWPRGREHPRRPP